jgi:hypothetical protein
MGNVPINVQTYQEATIVGVPMDITCWKMVSSVGRTYHAMLKMAVAPSYVKVCLVTQDVPATLDTVSWLTV